MSYIYKFIVECRDADIKAIRKIMKGLGKITSSKRWLTNPIYILRTDLSLGAVKKLWCDANCDLHCAYQSLNTEKDFDGTRGLMEEPK
jgi:hypothetical protein